MTSTFVNFRQNNSGLLVNIDDAIVLVSKMEDHLRLQQSIFIFIALRAAGLALKPPEVSKVSC